ncbi:hypothetical protein PIB30_037296 [Stylosanthes scabra]|uniref:Uncharacterized protein n=1 Tax=Stylosanthes scabra TaxID=79078 RepID=A0ABU6XDB5_9FABA|nr:hypothetical protein [Stylosanthes scabra]
MGRRVRDNDLRLITVTGSTRRSRNHTRSPHLPIIKSFSASLTVKKSSPTDFSLHQSYTHVLDKNGPEGPEMFVLDSKNISSPTEERTTLNKFASNILHQLLKWAGAPTILKKGS